MDAYIEPNRPENQMSEERDTLTGLYSYAAARERIERLFLDGVKDEYSCILMRLKNVTAMDAEYGMTFTGAIIENTATFIKHQYFEKGGNALVARISRDTFMIFDIGRSRGYTERTTRWLCRELGGGYFGRHKSVSSGVVAGVCIKPAGDPDFRSAIYNAGKALEYAGKNDVEIEFYDSEKESQYGSIADIYMDIRISETDERLFTYDNRFVSFAVAMLANAKDPQSSLDVLIQRLGWFGHFKNVLVCKFENQHFVRVISRYEKGNGIITDDEEEIADMNEWDGFIRSFDSAGCSRINDTSAPGITENDRKFFEKRGIGSALNFLLYDSGRPSGYVSLCSSDKNRKFARRSFDTFIQVSKIIGVFLSQRLRREDEEKRIKAMSKDFVTGLYIYAAFHDEAERILTGYDDSKSYALLYTDVDNFSYFNTTYGLEMGNTALRAVAKYLEEMCIAGGICAHLQADKFVTLLVRSSKQDIETAVKKMGMDLYTKYSEYGLKSRLGTSTGVYFIEKNNCNLTQAIERATQVWKVVKGERSGLYRIYDEDFRKSRRKRLDIIGSYQQAIKSGDITAFLQPKFSMRDWSTVGAEALCRWRQPNGSFRAPAEFLPALEENGQITEIDFYVYEQILKALKRWKEQKKHLIPVSVNFSRVHLDNDEFAERIIDMAERYEVSPRYIEIEITESTVSMSSESMLAQMQMLREHGFKIDMDDFGTGYSSLNMLIEAPIDVVKVDKSFIDKCDNSVYRAYIDRIGDLILTAKKDIIFEGVETKEQIEFLTGCGYDNAQGYVYSKPVPINEFEKNYIRDEKVNNA